MSQNYIPLEYDRSHLDIPKPSQANSLLPDYYDLTLIAINLVVLLIIFIYCLTTPKKVNEQIVASTERSNNQIPYFVFNRPGKKSKTKDLKQPKQIKEFNPHTQYSGYNLVQLKCLKCNYSTEVYESKTAPEGQP